MITATVLIQHQNPNPGIAKKLGDELKTAGLRGLTKVVATLGGYDVVAQVQALDSEGIGAAVVRIQEHPSVGRTLTLPHIADPSGLRDA
jgi:uncharacterized protein with GYD domain